MPTEEGATRPPRRHRRGDGSTYHDRGQDRWVAQLSLGIDPRTGKRRIVRRTVKDPRDVDDALAFLRRRYIGVGPVGALTLDDFLADWLRVTRPTVALRTHASYSQLVKDHVSPLLGGIRVAELRPADVKRLIADRLAAGLSPSSVHRVVGTLRMALGQAVADGELPTNVARVKLPRVEHEHVAAMTPEQADRILELVRFHVAPDGTEHGRMLEPVVTLLLGCGLRISEACALDWRDLRLPKPGKPPKGDETVTIRLGKTRAARRTIPLPVFVTEALLAHRGRATRIGPDEPVFIGEQGERLRRDTVSHAFKRVVDRAGLGPMRVHDLRHGTATLLVARGVPMRVVAEVLGHADPAITAQVYAHVSLDSKRQAMTEMDAMRRRSTHG